MFAAVLSISLQAAPGNPSNPGLEKAQQHYRDRVRSFREQNSEMKNVVLLGDSLTERFNTEEHFPGRRVVNRGISSDTIGVEPQDKDCRGVLHRLDSSVFDCNTTSVFLMIGINDLGDSRSLERMETGYRSILEQIRSRVPGIDVRVESLLPARGRFARLNEAARDFNSRLRKLAAEVNCPYMDLYPLFADSKGDLREDLTSDGLHINEAGYEILAKEIRREMGW